MSTVKEIGSEFWEVPQAQRIYEYPSEATQWYLSGRVALKAILNELKGCRTAALPSWCCDSMVKPFVDAGFDVSFYPVYRADGLVQELDLDRDVLFLMDYFGYTGEQPDLSDYRGVVLRDVTHSLFSAAYTDAHYSFGSLRKWCGVWTGGYAWTRDGHPLEATDSGDSGFARLRESAMRMKAGYIRGERDDKGYLELFGQAEALLEDAGIAPAADRDVALARHLDVEGIRSKRRANAEILRSAFPDWLIFPGMRAGDCPMFVPVWVPDHRRDALRRHLIENGIYCPVHWPVSEYHRLDGKTGSIYENELSLVCDQRYDEADMDRMVGIIERFMEG